MQTFDQQFRGAASMTLTFPNGNEPAWTVSLAGSIAISNTFGRCVRDLTGQLQAVQPPTSAEPARPEAIQPPILHPLDDRIIYHYFLVILLCAMPLRASVAQSPDIIHYQRWDKRAVSQ